MPFDPYYGNLEDEDLLSLAREAGVLSSPEEPAAPSPDAGYIDMEAPEPAVDTRQDFRDWVPGQLGGAPTPSAPGSVGMSVSSRGYSEEKHRQVSKTDGALDSALAGADAEAQARAAPMAAVANQAAASGRDAELAKAKAVGEKIHHEGEQALVMSRLQDEFAMEETRINADAQAMANQSKADYMAALMDFRASRVDPSQLWSNMTGGERFGTLMSAFVHDFLGAKGINTSAMSTLNKAIDRNIDAQLQAIKTKGEAAEGFKSLWWMQRNQSASDTEARTRVRGFLLEGAKQAVIANMAPYEAALASAQGKSAIAEIDKELSKTFIDIYKHTDQNALALRNQALDRWKTKLQASLESQALSLRAQELELARAGKGEGSGIVPIHDPETGKALWYFKPHISEDAQKKTFEMMEAMDALNENFVELRKLARDSESIADPIARTRLAGTIQQKMDALSTRMAHNFAKANDERATDKDVVDFLKGMKQKTWLNMGDVDQIVAFTHGNIIRPSMSKIKVVAFDMPEELQDKFGTNATRKPFAGSLADADATSNPITEAANVTQRKEALEGIVGPSKIDDLSLTSGKPGQRRLDEDEETTEIKAAHAEAARQYPHLFGPKPAEMSYPGGVKIKGKVQDQPIVEMEQNMVHLRNMARTDPKALKHLQELAEPYLNTKGSGTPTTEDPTSVFAALMLHSLTEE